MHPTQVVVVGFLCVILVGTFLLSLPISSTDNKFTDPISALFTATSATCVTGLSVETTAEHFSLFGQIVILVMIQVGGLGFMSMAVLFSLIVKRSMTPKEDLIIAESFGLSGNVDAARGFGRKILAWTGLFELLGTLLLSVRFVRKYGAARGIYYSIFHSVSAFCNAGFDVLGSDSLAGFSNDPVVVLTVSALIIIGGIGFVVWFDLGNLRNKKRLSPYTKLVLITTVVLLAVGTFATLILEWNNALADMSFGQRILNAFGHSVSLRTAGFSYFDNAVMTDALKFISILLMMIGGASGSTAGGIKVSTIAVMVVAVVSSALGKEDAVVFRRRIKRVAIVRAMSLFMIAITFTVTSALVISALDSVPMLSALYETVSAYATVGLSLSVTPMLGSVSRIILVVLMFMGRVGVLTLTFSLAMRSSKKNSAARFADTNIMIG